MRSTPIRIVVAAVVVTAVLVAGCSSSSDDVSESANTLTATAETTTDTPTTDTPPPPTSGSEGDTGIDDWCAVAETIESDVGGDALEVDELADHPDRYDTFKANLDTLDGLMERMVDVAPDDIADATRTVADAVADFNADAQATTTVDELIALDPDFDSGPIGSAADAVEDHADLHCGVDLDLD